MGRDVGRGWNEVEVGRGERKRGESGRGEIQREEGKKREIWGADKREGQGSLKKGRRGVVYLVDNTRVREGKREQRMKQRRDSGRGTRTRDSGRSTRTRDRGKKE